MTVWQRAIVCDTRTLTPAAKQNSAIINLIIYASAFQCQNISCGKKKDHSCFISSRFLSSHYDISFSTTKEAKLRSEISTSWNNSYTAFKSWFGRTSDLAGLSVRVYWPLWSDHEVLLQSLQSSCIIYNCDTDPFMWLLSMLDWRPEPLCLSE